MLANMSCNCNVKVLLKSTVSSGHNEAMSASSYTRCYCCYTRLTSIHATCYHKHTLPLNSLFLTCTSSKTASITMSASLTADASIDSTMTLPYIKSSNYYHPKLLFMKLFFCLFVFGGFFAHL